MPLNTKKKSNPLFDLLISIIIPSLILMNLSSEQKLGTTYALLAALAFPLSYGLYELMAHKKFNLISILGIVSVLLTGGIGIMELEPKWLAIKEAAIPLIIGLVVLGSMKTSKPLVKTMLYNPTIINTTFVDQAMEKRETRGEFEQRLKKASYLLSGTFFFSATLNYILARMIVSSPAGTEAFNEELGQLTLISYPVIALPSMVILMGTLFWLIRSVQKLSGLTLEEIIQTPEASESKN
ncbi:MAG: MFS transporter [Gammaproteobacteria bacterium]|nr:MAG: MFS transporter [Gammaproteobacteria bacterium]